MMKDSEYGPHETWCDTQNNISERCNCMVSGYIEKIQGLEVQLAAEQALNTHSNTFQRLAVSEQLQPLEAELAEQVRANKMLVERVQELETELAKREPPSTPSTETVEMKSEIQEMMDDLLAMPREEFRALLEKHKTGDLGKAIDYALNPDAKRESPSMASDVVQCNEIPKDLLQDLRDIRDELDTEITKLDLDHEDIRCRIYKRLSFHLLRLRETTPLAPDDRSVGEELLRSELASVYRDLDHTLRTGCMTADEQLKRTRLQVKETLDRWATLRASHLQTENVSPTPAKEEGKSE